MPGIQTRAPKSKAAKPSGSSLVAVKRAAKRSAPEICDSAAPTISAEERQRLIARAAYFRAERRGLAPGCELQDWIEAEAEMQRLIGGT